MSGHLANKSPIITPEVLALAEKIWDYHHLNHALIKADCILTLGSHDLRVADRAAQLYLQGFAPMMIFSGGLGNFTKGVWTEPEADQFAAIARKHGVPAEAILTENQSTNTGENILFTERLLKERGITIDHFIVVQKPYMERRSYATFKKHWPDKKLSVTSPPLSFQDYPNEEIPMERVIHNMIGDLQRIKHYPALGFQVEQTIPDEVWSAYERVVSLGFDAHLMK